MTQTGSMGLISAASDAAPQADAPMMGDFALFGKAAGAVAVSQQAGADQADD
jgi:hypothetical protein